MMTKTLVWTQFAMEEGRAPEPPEFYVNAGDKLELYVAREESEEKQMIYAIHNDTKRHFVIDEETHDWDGPMGEYRSVQATPDGWIEHDGRGCPLPESHLCDIRSRNGVMRFNIPAGVHLGGPIPDAGPAFWDYYGIGEDIIAYRPILDADTKVSHPGTLSGPDKYHVSGGEWPEPPAWNGEGLPPVDAVCEMIGSGEMTVKVLAYGKHGRDDAALVCETHQGVDDQMYGVLCKHVEFRPIRSEEERVVEAIAEALQWKADSHCRDWVARVYHAIRDGKVPGVKLAGGE